MFDTFSRSGVVDRELLAVGISLLRRTEILSFNGA